MIERLFTSKTRIKILKFVLFEKDQTHIREISSILALPVSAVKREVDNLLAASIFRKSGNKIEANKSCSFLEDIKNILIKTDYISIPLRQALENKNVDYAIIFGSFANEKETENSDVDLLVIGKLKQEQLFKF